MLNKLIDTRNKELWEKLNNKYQIELIEDPINGYSCFSQSDKIELSVDPNNLNSASFTHELLHAYLRYHDCYIGAALKNTILADPFLKEIMSTNLLEHMGNCLDHVKILPKFLELGFERPDFISDYNDKKCTKRELKYIVTNYKNRNILNKQIIDSYIGILVAMIADPNTRFNYQKELKEFKNLDKELFNITQGLFIDWTNIDIESTDIMNDDYNSVIFSYGTKMKEWHESNKIE